MDSDIFLATSIPANQAITLMYSRRQVDFQPGSHGPHWDARMHLARCASASPLRKRELWRVFLVSAVTPDDEGSHYLEGAINYQCFELVKLQRKDVSLDMMMMDKVLKSYLTNEPSGSTSYFVIFLSNRKGWQKRVDKGQWEADLR
ncbi:hypothetical protein M405DRAFT_848278, partial [Rhizopogon salebrosus TDB-379]